jgi:hypothetical protein
MVLPLPAVDDTEKVGAGNDRMNETRIELNALAVRVTPVSLGGTGATAKPAARDNLGISSGTAAPSGGADGDIYFKIV